MIARIAIACALLTGCSDPPLKLVYEVAGVGRGQSCGTSDCTQVSMLCDSVLHVRILSPSNPNLPHVVVCEDIPPGQRDMCAIGLVNLPADTVLPRETLEVQVTVWPREAVTNPNDPSKPDCGRTEVAFDAVDGFPTTSGPAFGGRAFYQPGDEETVVTLGCTNVSAVNSETCTGVSTVDVSASVLNFESLPMLVSSETAADLAVQIGEPGEDSMSPPMSLPADALDALERQEGSALWFGEIEATFTATACLHVDEDVPQSTPTLRCKRVAENPSQVDIAGIRVTRETLAEILAAIGLPRVPDDGMTIGIVSDNASNPTPDVAVATSTGATILYLDDFRTGIEPGATMTTNSGIFVSLDAPYPTEFIIPPGVSNTTAIGGQVAGKVTVVYFDGIETGGQ